MKTISGPNWTVYNGDCRKALPLIQPGSVHCVVTSPPYFGLRDYGTGRWEGGEASCDHVYNHGTQGQTGQRADRTFTGQAVYKDVCRKCGARRVDQQIGLEKTPDVFVEAMVQVFRCVRDVLRDDGTVWLNLGDSYANSGKGGNPEHSAFQKQATNRGTLLSRDARGHAKNCYGLKPKDLIGIPWRVAFALQEDGWYLRQDIVWHKPNPMPESVRDRCTKAHEYIFLLTKSARYHYDAEAVKEPVSGTANARGSGVNPKATHNATGCKQNESFSAAVSGLVDMRNKRSVWSVQTEPYPEAHFATFPPSLIAPCILAGCPEGGMVLDPFAGSGTTASVALGLGRQFVGCELNSEYLPLIEQRASQPWRPGVNGKREKPNPRWQSLFSDV